MENEKVAQILSALDFDRKRPVTSAQKKSYAQLLQSVDDVRQRLNKLHLRLWHASSRRDYHSLSLEDTREMLGDIARQIEAISKKNNELTAKKNTFACSDRE